MRKKPEFYGHQTKEQRVDVEATLRAAAKRVLAGLPLTRAQTAVTKHYATKAEETK